MDEPFYYLSAEDVVPRDAVYVIIGGSVRVVPPRAFRGHQNLARVEFQEGVEVIGDHAFAVCRNLERVDLPSSLRTIGDGAFHACGRLSEVVLPEGLEEIEGAAFDGCRNLERINLPSSVVTIGDEAFYGCERLSEVNLTEGLWRIGAGAFYSCALERITIPSSVVEIGREAFQFCGDLDSVTLAGGMVMVERGAFLYCPRLERITIPSMAIMVEAGEDGNGRAAYIAVTGKIERDPSLRVEGVEDDEDDEDEEPEPSQLILTSRYLALMSQEDRTTFIDAIDKITDDQTRRAGRLDLGDEDVADSIRDCFANCLAEYKAGFAAVLELALWKANMNQMGEASRARPAGGGKRARGNTPTRDDCRRTCGADIVIGPVLSYLWGPHRRAGQEEDGGSNQL